eukprot:759653-Hanusia_phi.AAC.4
MLAGSDALPHSAMEAVGSNKKLPAGLRSSAKHALVTKRAPRSLGLFDCASLAVVGAISGGLAGAVTDLVMYPVEMIKTRMQTVGLEGLSLDKPSECLQV